MIKRDPRGLLWSIDIVCHSPASLHGFFPSTWLLWLGQAPSLWFGTGHSDSNLKSPFFYSFSHRCNGWWSVPEGAWMSCHLDHILNSTAKTSKKCLGLSTQQILDMLNNQVLMTCQLGLPTPLLLFTIQFIGFFIYVHEFIYCLDLSDESIENNILIFVCVIFVKWGHPYSLKSIYQCYPF